MAVLSKNVINKSLVGAASVTTLILALKLLKKLKTDGKKRKKSPQNEIQYMIGEKPTNKSQKAHVNKEFVRQLCVILKITIPGVFSSEFGFLLLIAGSLIARSLCDIWMIQNGTMVETSIVNMDKGQFIKRLLYFFSGMPLIAVVNNILKWSLGELKLRLRTRLTHHLYDQYLNQIFAANTFFITFAHFDNVLPCKKLVECIDKCLRGSRVPEANSNNRVRNRNREFTFYKMSNLDNRIANADQLLTTDVDKFCDMFTDLYSNISKPVLDIFIYVYRLTATLGFQTPSLLLGYLLASGMLLTYLRRPVGRMTVTEQKLEGEFRYINSRLITNAEEVAFYNGNYREKLTLLASFEKLTNHLRKFLEFRVLMGIADNIVAKYIATIVGFFAVSIPFLDSSHGFTVLSKDERFRNYYTMGRMLVKLAEAIGRLVLAGREMTRLAGFTARVTEIMVVLNDLNKGHYVRNMIQSNSDTANNGELCLPTKTLIPGSGTIKFQDNIIRFDNVPLVTPNGDVLIESLTFEVKSGTNVLVCGPNGCGKSSLFRILGELWPLFGGMLRKPPRGKLFYIPQRPYMTLGTLRDQVIYPHTKEEMIKRGKTDNNLKKFLEIVQLSYVLNREDGWDTVADWIDVLSGGEKQRIAMARLFYHSPQFAILDECTSAVSVDVEDSMYQYCRQSDITLFTVSHRKSLWKHHEYYLQMDGRGAYEFKKIESDTEQFGS